MEYVIIRSGGKQYKVSKGDTLEVDRLSKDKDQEIIFPEVLLWVSDNKVEIGRPFVKNLKVSGKVLDHPKGEKIRVAKFKSKVRYRRVMGFRPYLTKVQITEFQLEKETPKARTKKITSVKAKK